MTASIARDGDVTAYQAHELTPEMPANILNLPDFKVQRVEEADHDYHVYAEVSNPPGACTACGSDRLICHGRNEQVIRDLPTHGKRLAIYVDFDAGCASPAARPSWRRCPPSTPSAR